MKSSGGFLDALKTFKKRKLPQPSLSDEKTLLPKGSTTLEILQKLMEERT
jgi:hypothetical protein